MAYDDEKVKAGRKPIRLVEIDLPKCALSYGEGVCQAGQVAGDTAQGGSTTYIDLAAGDVQADDYYNGMVLKTTGGTGSGQEVTITDYDNATNRASATFSPAVDGTTTYTIHDKDSSGACYNGRKHCQDPTNFDGSALLTLKLCEVTAESQIAMGAIPCIRRISTAHTRIEPARQKPGEKKEKIGGLQLDCFDFPHHDRGIDPYVANRTYTPEDQGTFFGKLKIRNPYFQDAEVRVKTGYWASGYVAGNFKTRTYYLEKFEGPDKRKNIKFVAQSPARRLDNKRVTCPVLTVGELTATLSAVETTSFTVSDDADLYDTGGGSVAIDDEVISYTSGLDNGDGTFTFSTLTRAVDGTTAAQHDAGESVQQCAYFNAQTARQIAYTLYTTYGGIAAGLIDTTQWDTIADTWLLQTYTRRIVEPTGVKDLLGECYLQMGFYTWWDEEAGKFYLDAIAPPDFAALSTYTETSNIKRGTMQSRQDGERRITQVHVYYDPRLPFDGSKAKHFKARFRGIDAGAEGDDEYGDSRILKIFARWLTSDSHASVIQGRILNRFRDNLEIIQFEMDAKDDALNTSGHFYLEHEALQDETGANGTTLCQVVQRDEIKSGRVYAYRAYVSNYFGRYALIAPAATPDYGSATDTQKSKYGFISPAGGTNYSDGGSPHKII